MTEDVGMFELTWLIFTLIVMAKWLLRNNWGRSSLNGCELPENKFHPIDAITSFAVFFLISFVSVIFLNEESKFENKMIVASIVGLSASMALLTIMHKRLYHGLGTLFKKNPFHVLVQSVMYSVPAIGMAGMVLAITILLCSWFGYDQIEKHRYLEEVFGDGKPKIVKVVLLYISAGLVTPLLEETMFRGLVQNIIAKSIGGKWPAIFIAAFLFALLHEDKQHWPALFVLGSFFGYSMVKTRSLVVPIVMHAIFNCYTITNVLLSELSK